MQAMIAGYAGMLITIEQSESYENACKNIPKSAVIFADDVIAELNRREIK